MKIKLEMVFDIPEKYYRDDQEDREVLPKYVIRHRMGFIRQVIFDEFTNYALCQHLNDRIEGVVKNDKECANHHKEWAGIIEEAHKTSKYTIVL